jgi:hypothetical protein
VSQATIAIGESALYLHKLFFVSLGTLLAMVVLMSWQFE